MVSVGWLLLLLVALLGAAPSAQAAGAIIFVPDDYPSIQQAIDAAQPGDEIRIVGGLLKEALFVSKNITLSGGWNAEFTGPSESTRRWSRRGAASPSTAQEMCP